jgi:hypothetical protein
MFHYVGDGKRSPRHGHQRPETAPKRPASARPSCSSSPGERADLLDQGRRGRTCGRGMGQRTFLPPHRAFKWGRYECRRRTGKMVKGKESNGDEHVGDIGLPQPEAEARPEAATGWIKSVADSLKSQTGTWFAGFVISVLALFSSRITEDIKFALNSADLRTKITKNSHQI